MTVLSAKDRLDRKQVSAMKMIYAIAPVIESAGVSCREAQRSLDPLKEHDIDIVSVFLDKGPTSIDNELDEGLCVPNIIEKALKAAEDPETAGIVVNCMLDPAVPALRAALSIPVLGPAQTTCHYAASLGHRFGILDVGGGTGPMVCEQMEALGLASSFAGVVGTEVDVEDIHGSPDTRQRLNEGALRLVLDHHADVIVLGCTGFAGLARAVQGFLQERNLSVPVIDPVPFTIRTMISMIREGHCHSKRRYFTPRRKALKGYDVRLRYDVV